VLMLSHVSCHSYFTVMKSILAYCWNLSLLFLDHASHFSSECFFLSKWRHSYWHSMSEWNLQVFAIRSPYAEVFANLPMTLVTLRDDVANEMAPRWFSVTELKTLNVSQPVDFSFASELYMMKEIINAVRFTSVCCYC